jgi:hypothetical protein
MRVQIYLRQNTPVIQGFILTLCDSYFQFSFVLGITYFVWLTMLSLFTSCIFVTFLGSVTCVLKCCDQLHKLMIGTLYFSTRVPITHSWVHFPPFDYGRIVPETLAGKLFECQLYAKYHSIT